MYIWGIVSEVFSWGKYVNNSLLSSFKGNCHVWGQKESEGGQEVLARCPPPLNAQPGLVEKNVGSGGYCEEAEMRSHSSLTRHQTTSPPEQKTWRRPCRRKKSHEATRKGNKTEWGGWVSWRGYEDEEGRGEALKEISINWSIFTFLCTVDSIRRKHWTL